jgi:hypothetical protein
MISLYGKITKKIDNNFRKFKKLTIPQNRNLKEIIKGLILTKTCFLSEIGRSLSSENNERKNIARYSNALEKTDSFAIIKTHLKSKKKWLNNGEGLKNPNLILVDGGEILKENCPRKFQTESTQKMQYCCGIADGSRHHEPAWGYKMNNISAYTPHNGRTHILSQHLFSSNAPDYKSDWDEQKRQMEFVQKIIDPNNSIIIEDSIGDDKQRINFYQNTMECSFIVRGQNKRKYNINFNGDRLNLLFSEIAENVGYDTPNTRMYFDKKCQRKVESKISYLPVEHPELPDKTGKPARLFLVLVKSEAYEIPMALLTNIKPKNTEEAWQIFFWYKKRWEVEKVYRDIKQKFKLESGLIRSYKAWQTLVVLTALAWEIMQELTLEARDFLGICYQVFKVWLRKKQKKRTTHLNLLDFLREFLAGYSPISSHRIFSWKFFLHRFSKDKNQLSFFDGRKKW